MSKCEAAESHWDFFTVLGGTVYTLRLSPLSHPYLSALVTGTKPIISLLSSFAGLHIDLTHLP